MTTHFTDSAYSEMISSLFQRFPSFQSNGSGAYKPGLANVEFFDQLAGHPHKSYEIIHVAGTNGKGSVSNMLASALASAGLRVGLYTSPHILDFRERMRVVQRSDEGGSWARLISKEEVWDFVQSWKDTFNHLDMSFFEITTMMALCWFRDVGVDVVVLEAGLGGRLDSTNIVSPKLSIITNIGLDHCDLLGDTLPEIAFEKAGIIKPEVPVVVGESNPETDPVFERKVLYTNLPEPAFMGSRTAIMSLLTFADKVEPSLWYRHEDILRDMDLRGIYQRKNLRTVLAAMDVLGVAPDIDAIINTASRAGFHGRWEKLSDNPLVICDIGHNEHGLKYNFAQLAQMKERGECTDIVMVYGSVADKDVDAALKLLPEDEVMVFTKASGKRAMDASEIMSRYVSSREARGLSVGNVFCDDSVEDAVRRALDLASGIAGASGKPVVYIGGSTYVVSEAVAFLK
jgi:dihydrofolate synthase/folylpolyglutamate synthase